MLPVLDGIGTYSCEDYNFDQDLRHIDKRDVAEFGPEEAITECPRKRQCHGCNQ